MRLSLYRWVVLLLLVYTMSLWVVWNSSRRVTEAAIAALPVPGNDEKSCPEKACNCAAEAAAANKQRMAMYRAPPPGHLPYPINDKYAFTGSYFTVCGIIKDQNADVREWVHYHHWLGAEEIYIYDHNSSSPLNRDLDDWIRSGVVIYNQFAGRHKVLNPKHFHLTAQAYAYMDCLRRSKGRHKWIAFIDVDEFLVLSGDNTNNITKFLKAYEAHGAVVANWRVFGSSGHLTRPNNISTLEAYTRCIPDSKESHNVHIKTIAHVPYTLSLGPCPHNFIYHAGYHAVTEDFRVCDKHQCMPVTANKIAVHHYTLKSLEEYQRKMRRGGGSGSVKRMDFFDSVNKHADTQCSQGVAVARQCCSAEHFGGGSD